MASQSRDQVVGGRYEPLELAGVGGMASVWRARMRGAAGFSRLVALKRIKSDLVTNDEFVAMFVEEARVGSQISHPNVVDVVDFGVDDQGGHFLVMEWVDGLDLRRYMDSYLARRSPAPWPLITAIAIEALRGLSAAHERLDERGRLAPVIHRDVSPQNIIVGVNGIVKLTDFGLARARDRLKMTRPGVVKGKLGYLAPEIAAGGEANPASDIFGVGVCVWEALAGRKLYQGQNDVEVYMAAKAGNIPPMAEFRTDLPAQLVTVLERMLAPEPEDRQASSHAALRQLCEVLRASPHSTDARVLAGSVLAAKATMAAREQPKAVAPAAARSPDQAPAGAQPVALPWASSWPGTNEVVLHSRGGEGEGEG